MTSVSATNARAKLYGLIASLQKGHEPVLITGKQGNAVLLSEEDWRNIEATLYLDSIPGMRKSILKGMAEPIENCTEGVRL